MKLKFGAIVSDGRGKLGGHVFSKNRSGSYMRTKVTPVNPSSTAQVEVRNRLSTSAQAWRGLTAAQRLQWNSAVGDFSSTDIFGDIKKPTGFNLFCMLNNNLSQVGVAQISVPPLPAAVASLTSITPAQVHAGATTLDFAATPTPANNQLVVKATPPVSAGKYFVKSEFRIIASLAPATATGEVLTTQYADVFGGPGLAGQKVFFEAYYINLTTGQKGLPLQASCIVS
jgi:hypothetical protein